jgi:hypothetical protein
MLSKLQLAIDSVRNAKTSEERSRAVVALAMTLNSEKAREKVIEAEDRGDKSDAKLRKPGQMGLDAAAKADLYREATSLLANTGPGNEGIEQA